MTDQPGASSRVNPFWDYSLRLYSDPGVQKACIDLQDGSGIDVNVMLYMLWHAVNGRQLSDAEAAGVLAAIEPWRVDVVVPLRTARRNLKSPPAALDAPGTESLRSIVKKAELEAERLQQQALYNLPLPAAGSKAQAGASRRQIATANLASYAVALGRPLAAAPLGVMLDAFDAEATASRAIR
ncbi:unnamed protein product [Phaeothamnion confervicola]